MLEMSINIKKEVSTDMVKKIKNFEVYVSNNSYYQWYIVPDKLNSTECNGEEDKLNTKQIISVDFHKSKSFIFHTK